MPDSILFCLEIVLSKKFIYFFKISLRQVAWTTFLLYKTPWLKQVAGARNWKLTYSMENKEKETESEIAVNGLRLLISKLTPIYILPPAKLYHPNFLKQNCHLGTKCSNTRESWGWFSFKSLYPSFFLFYMKFYFMNKTWIMYTDK